MDIGHFKVLVSKDEKYISNINAQNAHINVLFNSLMKKSPRMTKVGSKGNMKVENCNVSG